MILEVWKLSRLQRWAAQHPLLGRWLRMDLDEQPQNNQAVIVPVQEALVWGENKVLLYPILAPIIAKADGHLLLERCPCRNGEGCKTYPHDFGCLFLGESVKTVSPKIGRQTDAEGALAHIQQGIELGLVPMVVHARFDADLISVPYDRMLAVCFCCDCCCTVRQHLRMGPSNFDQTMQRLPGLTVLIGEDCTGCGGCHPVCSLSAIQFDPGASGRSVIDQERCKGCGLCVETCPNEAIALILDESLDVTGELVKRIKKRTEIGL